MSSSKKMSIYCIRFISIIALLSGLVFLFLSCEDNYSNGRNGENVAVALSVSIAGYGAESDSIVTNVTRNQNIEKPGPVIVSLSDDLLAMLTFEPDEPDQNNEQHTRSSNALDIAGTAVCVVAYQGGNYQAHAFYTVVTDNPYLFRSTKWELNAGTYTFAAFTYLGADITSLSVHIPQIIAGNPIPDILPSSGSLYGVLTDKTIAADNGNHIVNINLRHIFSRISKIQMVSAAGTPPIERVEGVSIISRTANLKPPLTLPNAMSKANDTVMHRINDAMWNVISSTIIALDTCYVYPGSGLVVDIPYLLLDDYSDPNHKAVAGSITYTRELRSGYSYTLQVTVTKGDGFLQPIPHSYVGAFWKEDEIGERIIRIFDNAERAAIFPPALDDYWTATVSWYDRDKWDFANGDGILLSTDKLEPSSLSMRGITWNAGNETPNVGNNGPENHPVTVGSTNINGQGDIIFRIGLQTKGNNLDSKVKKSPKWTYSNTPPFNVTTGPARYAIVSVFYGPNKKLIHNIYIRQGEGDDFTPGLSNGTRWSPFNLNNSANLVTYPSQAGYFYQWNAATAHHPINPPATAPATGWNDNMGGTFQLSAICPTGYAVPLESALNTLASSVQSTWISGYYADGWFDRRQINRSITQATFDNSYGHSIATPWWADQATSSYSSNPADVKNTQVAYAGTLLYGGANNASIFFPTAGYRFGRDYTGYGPGGNSVNGALHLAGRVGYYWSRSEDTSWGSGSEERASALRLFNDPWQNNNPYVYGLPRMSGFSVRCVR